MSARYPPLAACPFHRPVSSRAPPTRSLHGWRATHFACSRHPRTPYLYCHIAVLVSRDGRVVNNVSLYIDSTLRGVTIEVDSRPRLRAGQPAHSYPPFDDVAQLKVFTRQLQPVRNSTLKPLQPPATSAVSMQIVVDSSNYVYLFGIIERIMPQVWVFSPLRWPQQSSWQPPIPVVDNTRYGLGSTTRTTCTSSRPAATRRVHHRPEGRLAVQLPVGTGNISEPHIRDVAIDAQLQMWHTYMNSSAVSVIDSSGRLITDYNLLSMSYGRSNSAIDVDLLNNVVVTDGWEQAMLIVSPRGDLIRTLSPDFPVVSYMAAPLPTISAVWTRAVTCFSTALRSFTSGTSPHRTGLC